MPFNTAFNSRRAEVQRRNLNALLIGGNLLLGAALGGLVVSIVSSSQGTHEEQVRATAERFVSIASANLESELNVVDTALKISADELLRSGFGSTATDQDINKNLAAKLQVLEGVEGFRLADSNGLVRWGNLIDVSAPPDITNRDFFHLAKAATSAEPVVSGPVISRVSGNWIVIVARPVALDGEVKGVLYASIGADHFLQLFKRYELNGSDAISLRTADLQLVAKLPSGPLGVGAVGSGEVPQQLRDELRRRPAAGSYIPTSNVDGPNHTMAYRKVDGWPLVVTASLDNAHFFEQWMGEMRTVALLAGLVWALSCAVTLAVHRFGRREVRAVKALEEQSRRMQTLLRVAGDGIHILNQQGELIELSDSFAEMLLSTREALQGKHVSEWDANQDRARINSWLAKIKDGDRQRLEVQHARSDGSIIDIDLHWQALGIDGHLVVFGSARDITGKKRLVQSLEESSAQIRDLYDHAPCGYFSFDAEGRLVHVNAAAAKWFGEPAPGTRFAERLEATARQQFNDHFISLATQDHAPQIEICLTSDDGPPRYVRINSTAVRDAQGNFLMSRTVGLDITAQREAQLQVEALLRDQSAMLNSDIVGMVKLHDRKVSWKNAAFEAMLGYEEGELDGMEIGALCAEEGGSHALAHDTLQRMGRGERYRDDVLLRRKDGESVWVDLNGVQLSDADSFWMAVDISEAKRAHEHITHVAFHDALTQLPNRLLLLDRMKQALAGAERFQHEAAVCFIDLDGFKTVNDRYGHDAGDRLLVAIAARLSASIRVTDTAARLGGDEFVLLLVPLAGTEWRAILDRLQRSVKLPVRLEAGLEVQVGMSIGVALSKGRVQPEVLLAEADEAMLIAKRAGKGHIHLATTST